MYKIAQQQNSNRKR